MTNRELQDLLKQYPDCISVCINLEEINEVYLDFMGCINITSEEQ